MKLTCIILVVACLQVSAAAYSQKVTISKKDASLEKVFNEIYKQTGYLFLYKNSIIKKAKPVSIDLSGTSLDLTLQELFKYQPLTYKIVDNTIVVQERKLTKPQIEQKTITGTITDENGNPMVGTTVVNKTTGKAVTADIDGKFTIAASLGDVLEIRMIGFETYTIRVTNENVYNVQLKQENSLLSEVVVVGFGTQKKVNLTGAVSMITAEDIDDRPITSVSTALQGLMPGLTSVSPSGQPGGGNATLRIRGIGTTNNADPFIVIDGVPGSIDFINPNDIESVSVLKDAASAAIYGSRAANGVILVTTKKGKLNQKPTLNYNGYYGIQKPTALPEMLSSVEYMQMLNEAQRNVNLPPTFTDEQIEIARNGSDPDYFANTNWTDALIKDYAPQHNHNISLNGGSTDFSYYASYARLNQDGLVEGNQYKGIRNNARLRFNANNIFNLVDLDANLSFLDRTQNQPGDNTDAGSGAIYQTMTASPLTPVRFTNGNWGYGGGSSNPLATAADGGFNTFTAQEFTGNLSGTIHLLKNLDAKVQYGLNRINQKRSVFNRKIDYLRPTDGSVWYTNRTANEARNIDFTSKLESLSGQLDYAIDFNDHHFKVLAGYQQEVFRYDSWSASKMGFVSDDVPVLNLGSTNPEVTGDAYQYALRSYLGRVNYDFKDKYLFEFVFRYDGSSRYLPGKRYGSYPSASAGWRFTQEEFFKNISSLKWLSEGKFRVSYGDLGNQYGANGPAFSEWYPYLNVLTGVSTMPIGNVDTKGIAQTILANPMLEWEKVNVFNVGLDLGLLNNRLTVNVDWYNKKTTDIQLKVPMPDVLGLTVPDQNAGTISNKGWDLALGWKDKIRNVRYGLDAQLSDVKNEVISLGAAPPDLSDNVQLVGFPLNAYYGYRTDGLAQESDFTLGTNGKLVPNFPIITADASKIGPGDIKYRDLNNDGVITADKDREVMGDSYPRYTYSFRGNVGYKNFDFNFFLQGVGKGNGYVQGAGLHAFHANGAFPQEVHRNHWTPENTGAWYPRFTYLDTRNTRMSDYWLQDASYLRLKNVQLAYTVPSSLISKWHVDQLRFYVSADNLFTASDFFYAYDPESPTTSGGLYPQVKTVVFGVNFRFK